MIIVFFVWLCFSGPNDDVIGVGWLWGQMPSLQNLSLFPPPFFFFFFNFIYLFIYLFIFGCVGSSFLCEGFL